MRKSNHVIVKFSKLEHVKLTKPNQFRTENTVINYFTLSFSVDKPFALNHRCPSGISENELQKK